MKPCAICYHMFPDGALIDNACLKCTCDLLRRSLQETLEHLEIVEDVRRRDNGEWYWTATGETICRLPLDSGSRKCDSRLNSS